MSYRAPPAPRRPSAAVLEDLALGWHERVDSSRSRAEIATGVVVLFAALLAARQGTTPWRAGAFAFVAVAASASAWMRYRERTIWGESRRVIEHIAGPIDTDRAGRAIRALTLIAESTPEGTSVDLAHLHADRTVEALPQDRIFDRAARVGGRYANAALVLALCAVALGATRGFSIFEGADVLLATKHEGPLPVLWLDALEVEVRPPDYLHEHERLMNGYRGMTLPRGTLLTFRAIPLHAGRRLFLSDGEAQVPFEDDGEGHVVARWTLAGSAALKVHARFGDVALVEAQATDITSIDDETPTVTLEGAPREIRLAEVGVKASIEIKYEAEDDHGLREVDLVLRSGAREERRVLAHLDGETQVSRGGHTLHASDPFIKKSHAPVEIRVEAKDNDPITGPKWGASPPIMVIPPEAGEPEALRMDALRKLRDVFVDSLASRMDRTFPAAVAGRAALAQADKASVAVDEQLLEGVSKGSFAGVSISKRIMALLRGQMRRVKEALVVELRSPGSASHGRLVAATERLVLVTDAVTRGLAQRDARSVARSLADVADDLVLGTTQMSRTEDRDRGEMRADGSVVVLTGGGRSLERLGSLGRDLGEIVGADLLRVARAREQGDLVHAEIAASDLASRLKDPDPSFGSQGSSGGRGGGESGGGRGTPGEDDPSDEAGEAFEEAARDVSKLASDHAEEMNKVEEAQNQSEGAGESEASSQDDKSHARAVRDATGPLPSVGAGSDSWTNKGAAAREHGESMARALEEGNAADAVTNGRSALDAIAEAKHIAEREKWTSMFSPADQDPERSGANKRLEDARKKLEPEVKWAEEKLAARKKQAALRRSSEISSYGEEEGRLADRAGALRERGDGPQALPEAALDELHQAEQAAQEAASSLKRGDVDEGMAHQREAQRRLEKATEALGGESGDESAASDGGESAQSGHADIPGADAHKGPEDFRRRVLQGLGQAGSGRQKDAVRRYADGLLR